MDLKDHVVIRTEQCTQTDGVMDEVPWQLVPFCGFLVFFIVLFLLSDADSTNLSLLVDFLHFQNSVQLCQ